MNTVMFMPMYGRRLFWRWTEKILADDFGERDVCHSVWNKSDKDDKGTLMKDLFKIFIHHSFKNKKRPNSGIKKLGKNIKKRLLTFVQ